MFINKDAVVEYNKALDEVCHLIRKEHDVVLLKRALDFLEYGLTCIQAQVSVDDELGQELVILTRALIAATKEKIQYIRWRQALN